MNQLVQVSLELLYEFGHGMAVRSYHVRTQASEVCVRQVVPHCYELHLEVAVRLSYTQTNVVYLYFVYQLVLVVRFFEVLFYYLN